MLPICIVFLASFISHATSHSWLACTDYTEKNGGTWNPNFCRGFPRNAEIKAPRDGTFGLDTGYDYSPNEAQACGQSKGAGAYTQRHPMAIYYPGQQVVLVHPMKNHGADIACGTIWMPDSGSWLYRGEINNNGPDPTLSRFREKLVFDLGRSPSGLDFGGDASLSSVYPKPGYGNAPRFCDNTDKAMATYSFNVPRNLRPGVYTFLWIWAFNGMGNIYSSCFEVNVARNKAHRNSLLRANGITDYSEPCGGMTSNPQIAGNSNPGCTPTLERTFAALNTQTQRTTTPLYYRWTNNNVNNVRTQPTTMSTTTTVRPTTTRRTVRPYRYTTTTRATTTTTLPSTSSSPRPGISRLHLSIQLHMKTSQFAGELWLPMIRPNIRKRYFSVDFSCSVERASFWNCRIISGLEESAATNHYDLLQEGARELNLNRIYYHVSFAEPCDLSQHSPVVRLVQEIVFN
nr:uncharacterized protein LOC101242977 [Ciona intestinalis]|eukprot:XP_004225509.2 uncharacterized protein LOC101242977 [Ciona intestinalis]